MRCVVIVTGPNVREEKRTNMSANECQWIKRSLTVRLRVESQLSSSHILPLINFCSALPRRIWALWAIAFAMCPPAQGTDMLVSCHFGAALTFGTQAGILDIKRHLSRLVENHQRISTSAFSRHDLLQEKLRGALLDEGVGSVARGNSLEFLHGL